MTMFISVTFIQSVYRMIIHKFIKISWNISLQNRNQYQHSPHCDRGYQKCFVTCSWWYLLTTAWDWASCIAALWSKGWTKFQFSLNVSEHQNRITSFCHLIVEQRRHLNATICYQAVYVCDEPCCTYSTAEGTSAFQKCHFCGIVNSLGRIISEMKFLS